MSADREFSGKHAVITGGARGMGFAAAQRLLAAGGTVTLWDVNAEALESAQARLGEGAAVAVVDIADYAAVEQAMAEAAQAGGGVHILINCAGIAGVNALVEDFPIEVWHKVMAVNLGGIFHCCRAAVPHMRRAGYGRIVNLASVAGKEGNPNASAYSASKAGVIALTKSLGKELARSNITCNVVTPAVIQTEMLADVSEEQLGYMLAKIPMGRPGTAEEVAEMIAFLASDRAAFSTAAVFDMTGGRSTY
ncbi:SDR family NAD(P)-dependent oxidoreductase [Caulobacter sp. X]|uniref:SDR family oxidoreductase n=1 Tax=Caulobacter sp. X TaxID=2048901 RepID=UPI000C1596B5|nr:SDR family NAD(P)-dependent oxidoreductase [Caulobacter sp. X]PIB95232.1 3-oxoacyl-ACP reductase [Caulobacter sp. X]